MLGDGLPGTKPPVVRIYWHSEAGEFWTFGYVCRKLESGKLLVAFTTHFGEQPARIMRMCVGPNGGQELDLTLERPVLRPDKTLDVSFAVVDQNGFDLDFTDPLPFGDLPVSRGMTARAYADMEYLEPLHFKDARHLFTPTHDRDLAELMSADPLRITSMAPRGEMRRTPVWSESGYLLGLMYKTESLPVGERVVLLRSSKLRELIGQLGY